MIGDESVRGRGRDIGVGAVAVDLESSTRQGGESGGS